MHATYESLLDELTATFGRDDKAFVERFPSWAEALEHALCYGGSGHAPLRIHSLVAEAVLSLKPGEDSTPLPGAWLETIALSDAHGELCFMAPMTFFPARSGAPHGWRHFTIEGAALHTVAGAGDISLRYYAKPAPMVPAASPGRARDLLSEHGELYRSGLFLEAHLFSRNMSEAAMWDSRFAGLVSALNEQDYRGQFSGTDLVMRPV